MGKYSIHLEHLSAWGTQSTLPMTPAPCMPTFSEVERSFRRLLSPWQARGGKAAGLWGALPTRRWVGFLGFSGLPVVGLGVETSSTPKILKVIYSSWIFLCVCQRLCLGWSKCEASKMIKALFCIVFFPVHPNFKK